MLPRCLLRTSATLACAAFVGLAACSTTTSGTPITPTSPTNPTSGTGTGTAGPASFPTNVHDLAATVQATLLKVKSMHLVMTLRAAGLNESAEGDQTVTQGRTQDSNLTLSIPSFGTIQMVTVHGTTYVQVPPNQRTSNKPWSVLSPTSSNPFVRALAPRIQQAQSYSGPHAALQLLGAAKSFTYNGTGHLGDGTEVGRYHLSVGVEQLPLSAESRAQLHQFHVDAVPINLAIDPAGHVCELSETVTVHSGATTVTTSIEVQMSNFNNPVNVDAPPRSEIQFH